MTVKELVAQLLALPAEQQDYPVFVQDGLTPSDMDEASRVIVKPQWNKEDAQSVCIECF